MARLAPHKRGTLNHNAKLDRAKVLYIRASSRSNRALARELGVSKAAISNVRTGRTWSWLDADAALHAADALDAGADKAAAHEANDGVDDTEALYAAEALHTGDALDAAADEAAAAHEAADGVEAAEAALHAAEALHTGDAIDAAADEAAAAHEVADGVDDTEALHAADRTDAAADEAAAAHEAADGVETAAAALHAAEALHAADALDAAADEAAAARAAADGVEAAEALHAADRTDAADATVAASGTASALLAARPRERSKHAPPRDSQASPPPAVGRARVDAGASASSAA